MPEKRDSEFPAASARIEHPVRGSPPAGIDFTAGLERFDEDEETYLGILSSYFSQIQTVLERIRNFSAGALGDYKIVMHSLKSTSYSIGAGKIGSVAEELEKAALSADIAYINANNARAVEMLEELIPDLGAFLKGIKGGDKRPVLPAPDPALLEKVLAACTAYDMERLDAAMDELEQYRYETRSDLVEWLRGQADKSELESIKELLLSLK
jgi:HPt (histidine-containing phosphotransfer) domain-containing protein